MSRIGRRHIKIPTGVKVEFKNGLLNIEGPKGKMSEVIHPNILVKVENSEVIFTRNSEERQVRTIHGTIRSNVQGKIIGVSEGFMKELEINGVGYKAELKGDRVDLSVGFSYPKPYKIPAGIKIDIEKGIRVKISGIDKQLVGKVASEIRKIRPPEPYRGKGIKYATEVIKKKVGKAAVTQAS